MTEPPAGPRPAARSRRSALPTLVITLVALLAVLGVLLVTGHSSPSSEFGLQLNTPVVTVTSGDSIETTVTVQAQGRFRGTVTLSTSGLPAGLQASFDPPTLSLSDARPVATATLRLHATRTLPAGALGVGVIATAGGRRQSSLVQLRVQPDGSLTTVPAAVPSPGPSSFAISGSPVGALLPGASLPIDVHLDNAGPDPVQVATLTVAIAGTSAPACRTANFAVTQYRGRYPLQLAAGSRNTLSALGIPRDQWPRLAMRDLPVNQDACKGVTVQLRFSGTGAGT